MMGIIYEYAKCFVLYENDVNFANLQSEKNRTYLIENFWRKLWELHIFYLGYLEDKQILGYFSNFRRRGNPGIRAKRRKKTIHLCCEELGLRFARGCGCICFLQTVFS